MENSKRFRVIIVGGGVAGLTLALTLEKVGVDYVLLEKWDIAPDIGAAISVLPSTAIVHEQLGIKPFQDEVVNITVREHFDKNGRMFWRSKTPTILFEKVNQYMIFVRRQDYLETLYDSVKDKTKVRSRTGLTSFCETENIVRVTTDSGETIEGSILVGTDGVNSTTRTLMTQSLEGEHPKRLGSSTESFTVNYRALIGTSRNYFKRTPKRPFMDQGHMHNVYYEGMSGFSFQGVEALVFWGILLKQEQEANTNPHFTDADCEAAIAEYGNLRLGADYTFDDLWESRLNASMVLLEEGVLDAPWNNRGRVVLLGDSVHKATINIALGGNLAVDATCNLANELVPLLSRAETAHPPSREELARAFDRYEAKQRPRANLCVRISNFAMRFETQENRWLRLARHLIPYVPERMYIPLMVWYVNSAPRLNFLPQTASKEMTEGTSS